jgi:putative N6-adenine-specific DNA methylase
MFEYRKKNRYFAQITGSLEILVKKELSELGATNIEITSGGCHFTADDKSLYTIILMAKTCQRILAPLVKFDCFSPKYLGILTYKDIHWSQLFNVDETFGIVSNVKDSIINNSLYAGQVMKDAICNQFILKHDRRPNFTLKDPDILFNLHIDNNKATISLDLTGASMHKRGYKTQSVKSSIQETIAAALLRETDWDGSTKLLDFMCGSGTFLGEAILNYCKLPNDLLKENNNLKRLPNFNKKLWDQVKEEIESNKRPLPKHLIFANDISPTAVVATKENLAKLPYGDRVIVENRNFKDIKFIKDCTIIINPPYGNKYDDQDTLRELYKDLGNFLKKKCVNCQVYILTGHPNLINALKIKPVWEKSIRTGPINSLFIKLLVNT